MVRHLILLAFLGGCSVPDNVVNAPREIQLTPRTDAGLLLYVQEYGDLMNSVGARPSTTVDSVECVPEIGDADDGSTYVGRTYWHWDFPTWSWHTAVLVVCSGPPIYIRAIVYHELTHGAYDLGHMPEENEIQSATLPDPDELEAHWPILVSHLVGFVLTGGAR